MAVTFPEFQVAMGPLYETFTDKPYPESKVRIFWEELKELEEEQLTEGFRILAATSRGAPLLNEIKSFFQADINEIIQRLEQQVEEQINSLPYCLGCYNSGLLQFTRFKKQGEWIPVSRKDEEGVYSTKDSWVCGMCRTASIKEKIDPYYVKMRRAGKVWDRKNNKKLSEFWLSRFKEQHEWEQDYWPTNETEKRNDCNDSVIGQMHPSDFEALKDLSAKTFKSMDD